MKHRNYRCSKGKSNEKKKGRTDSSRGIEFRRSGDFASGWKYLILQGARLSTTLKLAGKLTEIAPTGAPAKRETARANAVN